jgi:hypothetical protein
MSWSRARTLGILIGLTAVPTALLIGRGAAGVEPSAGPARSLPAAGAAFTDGARADSAPAAKPRREIVAGVEVVVNIPAGRLELVAGDSVVGSYPVSVGSARYPTPVGDYLLATVIWNPWWNPPPESQWARNRKPVPPGPGNPMGRVKLHMDELIFIHGTTSEGRLGAPASHGCIRMRNSDVVDLARRLNRYAAPDVSDARLDALAAAGREERHTVMERSIRMRVTYKVAELRGDRLRVFPDVYGKAGDGFSEQVKRELARGGVDAAQLPAAAMARLRQGAARGGASFALADIPSLVPLPPLPRKESGPALLGTPVAASPAADAPVTDTVRLTPTEAREPAAAPETPPVPAPAAPPAEEP